TWTPPARDRVMELALQVSVSALLLWVTVLFLSTYGLNLTFLAWLPVLIISVRHGMPIAALALIANSVAATTLWQLLGWADIFPSTELRLLAVAVGGTVLCLTALVEQQKRTRTELARSVRQIR